MKSSGAARASGRHGRALTQTAAPANPEPLLLRCHLRLAVRWRVRHPSGRGDPDHRPHPEPGSGMGKSGVRFPVGRIESGWQYAGDAVTYTITVPCNLTAEITLPGWRKLLILQPGTPPFCNAKRFPARHNAPYWKE
ncbi:alpha-L-rhamnosidase C-terminal domain-containing protein [Faecalibacterium prausnitzii]|uniref:alpha-L-rhamnosidase C-terminal domain-containing protein n=1 Tax=Faecalibacterium prausnitzii TaxID=853 RepID=UPI003AAA2227